MRRLVLLLTLFPVFAIAQSTDSAFIRTMANDVLINGKAYDNLHYLTKQIGDISTCTRTQRCV